MINLRKVKKTKYTKSDISNMRKYIISYIYQGKFIHIGCVCSTLIPKYQLLRDEAKKELRRIISLVYS